MKNYEVTRLDYTYIGTFTGNNPRQAALKVASRGHFTFYVREKGRRNKDGTVTLHRYWGEVKEIKPNPNKKGWLALRTKIPNVHKVKTIRTRLTWAANTQRASAP